MVEDRRDPVGGLRDLIAGMRSPGKPEPERKPARAPKGAASKANAVSLAGNAVDTLDRFARIMVDKAAGMSEAEKEAIREPLAAMIADSNALAKSAKVVNPVALVLALGAWLFKVYTILNLKKQMIAATQAAQQDQSLGPAPAPAPAAPAAPAPAQPPVSLETVAALMRRD